MIVDKLKQSILQSAISGNLTSQNMEDKSSFEIVNKLLIEKKKLENEKKILKKKWLNNDEIDKPFNIPDNWCWSYLSNVSVIQEGAGIRKYQYKNSGIQLFSVTNILDGSIDLEKKKLYISEKEFNDKYKHLQLNIGDIVTACSGGSWGKVAIYDSDDIVMLNTSTLRLRFFGDLCNNKYLYYVIKSSYFKKMLSNQLVGIQPNFGYSHYSTIPIPIPPLEEQQRIVDKIEELFAKLDEIKTIEDELEMIKSVFPNIMEKSILESAIMGKLSRQNLDEKITLVIDKIHKITPPFDIPKNWSWYSHNDLFEIVGGSQPPKSRFFSQKKEGYIRLYQIRDYGPNPQPIYVKKDDVTKFSDKGDIILARYGGSLGKVFWAESGAYNVALAKVIIKYPQMINKKYLYYYYLADLYQSKVKNGNRSAQAGFSKDDLNDLTFPLPPIEEQQRIVDKLEQLLPLCDDIANIVEELNND